MSSKHQDGDWICSDESCANVNFARRTHCNRCGTEKSRQKTKNMGVAIGKQMAEKSKGLFSADDWQCKTCGNVNWARRSECNICRTPKVGKVESRTGYGGGFNERDSVEYIEREESDDEFDEFGRVKKKFRGKFIPVLSVLASDKVTPKNKQEVKEVEETNDDEEEENEGSLDAYKLDSDGEDDDDDDADVSNYILSDDDDAETNKSKPAASLKKSTTSKSRSRSRSGSRTSSSSRSSTSSSGSSLSRSHSRSNSQSGKRKRSRSSSRSRSRSDSRDRDSHHKKGR